MSRSTVVCLLLWVKPRGHAFCFIAYDDTVLGDALRREARRKKDECCNEPLFFFFFSLSLSLSIFSPLINL
jgi:hypothetical protein